MAQKQLAAVLHADWKPRPTYKPSEEEVRTRRAVYASRVWHKPRVQVEEIPVPDIGPREVLVRLKACGICGSDMHLYESDKEGYILYPGLVKTPVVLGHELAGIVEKTGGEVTGVRTGDYVVCEEMWYCNECDPCRTGNFNQCINLQEMGFTDDGGCQQYMKIHQKFCWKINDFKKVFRTEDKIFEAGSLVEPACVAYNGMFIRAGGFKPGSSVAVWGTGPIGLGAVGLAKAAGAGRIFAFEPMKSRAAHSERSWCRRSFRPIRTTEIWNPTLAEATRTHWGRRRGHARRSRWRPKLHHAASRTMHGDRWEDRGHRKSRQSCAGILRNVPSPHAPSVWYPGARRSRSLAQCHQTHGVRQIRHNKNHHQQIPGCRGPEGVGEAAKPGRCQSHRQTITPVQSTLSNQGRTSACLSCEAGKLVQSPGHC